MTKDYRITGLRQNSSKLSLETLEIVFQKVFENLRGIPSQEELVVSEAAGIPRTTLMRQALTQLSEHFRADVSKSIDIHL